MKDPNFSIPFVILDGPSGTGKSTVQSVLKTVLPEFLVTEEGDINEQYQYEYGEKMKGTNDPFGKARLFVEYRSLILKDLKQQEVEIGNQGIISIRGESTTIVYQGEGDLEKMEDIYNLHREMDIPKPDTVVVISVSENIVKDRIKNREEPTKGFSGKFTTADNRSKIHNNYGMLKEFLEDKGIRVLEIDSSKKTPIEVTKTIIEFLATHGYINKELYEKSFERLYALKHYEKVTEIIARKYMKNGRKFDLTHTNRGLEILEAQKNSLPVDIYKVLYISFALHDIGYSLVNMKSQEYAEVIKNKEEHSKKGSDEAKEILESEEYPFSLITTQEERDLICYLILHHDEVENIIKFKYKDFDLGRFLMSLDTLGAYSAIAHGEATFTKSELIKYIDKNDVRRGSEIHPMLSKVWEETRESVNK